MKTGVVRLLAVVTGALCMSVAVADFDGSEPLICSFGQIFECDAGKSKCHAVSHESVDAPDFIKLDFRRSQIVSMNGAEESAPDAIDNIDKLDNYLVAQGVQGGSNGDTLAWSASISYETGQIVVTAAGEKAGFVVFGACAALE